MTGCWLEAGAAPVGVADRAARYEAACSGNETSKADGRLRLDISSGSGAALVLDVYGLRRLYQYYLRIWGPIDVLSSFQTLSGERVDGERRKARVRLHHFWRAELASMYRAVDTGVMPSKRCDHVRSHILFLCPRPDTPTLVSIMIVVFMGVRQECRQ